MNRFLTLVSICLVSLLTMATAASAQKVLYIDSYHEGYEWSDGITRGVRSVLDGKDIELRVFRMDTKRNAGEGFKKEAARKAIDLIKSFKPDVVIASDDNASKYIIQPYYKDSRLPFIFCGVNNNASKYGFPYRNVTGMVEVAPVAKLVYSLKHFNRVVSVGYLASDTMTERMDGESYKEEIGDLEYLQRYVKNMDQWVTEYETLQDEVDILIVGNNAGVKDWSDSTAKRTIYNSTRIPTGCVLDWLVEYTFLGYTKVAEEQGQWAANAVLKIMDGTPPESIPIAKNRKGNLIINTKVAEALGVKVPRSYTKIAKNIIR